MVRLLASEHGDQEPVGSSMRPSSDSFMLTLEPILKLAVPG